MKMFLMTAIMATLQMTNALWFPHLTPKAYEKGDKLEIFAG